MKKKILLSFLITFIFAGSFLMLSNIQNYAAVATPVPPPCSINSPTNLSLSPDTGTTNTPFSLTGTIKDCVSIGGGASGLEFHAINDKNPDDITTISFSTNGSGNVNSSTAIQNIIFDHSGTWHWEILYQSHPITSSIDIISITQGKAYKCGDIVPAHSTDCPNGPLPAVPQCPASQVPGTDVWTCGGTAPESTATTPPITLSISPTATGPNGSYGPDTIYGNEERAVFTYTTTTAFFDTSHTYYAYFYRPDGTAIPILSAKPDSPTKLQFIFDRGNKSGGSGSDDNQQSFNYWVTGRDNPHGSAGQTEMYATFANDLNLNNNWRTDANAHGRWEVFLTDNNTFPPVDLTSYTALSGSALFNHALKASIGTGGLGPYVLFWAINPLSFDKNSQPIKIGGQDGIAVDSDYTLDVHLPDSSSLPGSDRTHTKYCMYTNGAYIFTPTAGYITTPGDTKHDSGFNSTNVAGNSGNPEFCLDQINWSGGSSTGNTDMCAVSVTTLFDPAKFEQSKPSCSFFINQLIFAALPTNTPTPTPPLPPCKYFEYTNDAGAVVTIQPYLDPAGNYTFPTPVNSQGTPIPYRCGGIDTAVGPFSLDASGFIAKLFAVILSLSGGIVILSIIYAGYRILTSNGNPETLKSARERLTGAIVGLLFIIFSLVLLQFIGVDILGLPGFGK